MSDAVPMLRILGVDPGSRNCGYGLLEVPLAGRGVRYLECGVLAATPTDPPEVRLAEIARLLKDVIGEFSPSVLAVESVFSRINPNSSIALAQARGAVLAVAGLCGVTVHSYAPAVVKLAVTGRGRAGKEQVARMVQGLLGLRNTPALDAADALAVALTHAQRGVHG